MVNIFLYKLHNPVLYLIKYKNVYLPHFNPQLNLTYKWTFNNTLDNIVELPTIESLTNDANVMSSHVYDDATSYNTDVPYTNVIVHNPSHSGSKNQQQQIHQKKQNRRFPEIASAVVKPSASAHIYPYKVESFQHFGTITCQAQNAIGQSGPCLYHIMSADIPDPVRNCSASNSTANSIHISCQPGKDGGIQQYFHVEISEDQSRTILYNISYKSSDFILKRLPSDSIFRIRITAYNLQGSSTAYRLRGRTLPAPLLRTGKNTFQIFFYTCISRNAI